jgi:hypothetical protein
MRENPRVGVMEPADLISTILVQAYQTQYIWQCALLAKGWTTLLAAVETCGLNSRRTDRRGVLIR